MLQGACLHMLLFIYSFIYLHMHRDEWFITPCSVSKDGGDILLTFSPAPRVSSQKNACVSFTVALLRANEVFNLSWLLKTYQQTPICKKNIDIRTFFHVKMFLQFSPLQIQLSTYFLFVLHVSKQQISGQCPKLLVIFNGVSDNFRYNKFS